MKVAKADLVPTLVNLAEEYASFARLEAGCQAWCERVNGRVHRDTAALPEQRLAAERAGGHQTIRFGSVRYSALPGHVGERVW